MAKATVAFNIRRDQQHHSEMVLAKSPPSPAAIISELRGAIDWHPLGAKGPWAIIETPDYAEIHSEGIASPVALVGISTTDARAIAEVPAMVMALRQYRDDMRHPPTADSRERRITMIEGLLSRIEGKRA